MVCCESVFTSERRINECGDTAIFAVRRAAQLRFDNGRPSREVIVHVEYLPIDNEGVRPSQVYC